MLPLERDYFRDYRSMSSWLLYCCYSRVFSLLFSLLLGLLFSLLLSLLFCKGGKALRGRACLSATSYSYSLFGILGGFR